jgi:hypothetical protein
LIAYRLTALRKPHKKASAGIPACSAKTANAIADNGFSKAGLATKVQPAASARAALLASMALGKFHGVIEAALPIGYFTFGLCEWLTLLFGQSSSEIVLFFYY